MARRRLRRRLGLKFHLCGGASRGVPTKTFRLTGGDALGVLRTSSVETTTREYSAAELDLMAKAYDRAYEQNSATLQNLKNIDPLLLNSIVESFVSGIVEAIDRGERNEEQLVSAALSKASSVSAVSS
jgi:hypothetical protein